MERRERARPTRRIRAVGLAEERLGDRAERCRFDEGREREVRREPAVRYFEVALPPGKLTPFENSATADTGPAAWTFKFSAPAAPEFAHGALDSSSV